MTQFTTQHLKRTALVYEMVSFVCNCCQETIKKPKLDTHLRKCKNATFTCIDCMTDFQGVSYRTHISCMTEKEKYENLDSNKKKTKLFKDPLGGRPTISTANRVISERSEEISNEGLIHDSILQVLRVSDGNLNMKQLSQLVYIDLKSYFRSKKDCTKAIKKKLKFSYKNERITVEFE